MEQKKMLFGLEEIAFYFESSPNTIRHLVRKENFPAVKLNGRWESNTELIDKYQQKRVESHCAGSVAV